MNDLQNVPAAACKRCGGWTSFGGCSAYADATGPVNGRTGCTCNRAAEGKMSAARDLFDQMATEIYYGFNLRQVLAEASVDERDAIRMILDRAKVARTDS